MAENENQNITILQPTAVVLRNRNFLFELLKELDPSRKIKIDTPPNAPKVPQKPFQFNFPTNFKFHQMHFNDPHLLDKDFFVEIDRLVTHFEANSGSRAWVFHPSPLPKFANFDEFKSLVNEKFVRKPAIIQSFNTNSGQISLQFVQEKSVEQAKDQDREDQHLGCSLERLDDEKPFINYSQFSAETNVNRVFVFIPAFQSIENFIRRLYEVEVQKVEMINKFKIGQFLGVINEQIRLINDFSHGVIKNSEITNLSFIKLIKQMQICPILDSSYGQDILFSFKATCDQDFYEDLVYDKFQNDKFVNQALTLSNVAAKLDSLLNQYEEHYSNVQVLLSMDFLLQRYQGLLEYIQSLGFDYAQFDINLQCQTWNNSRKYLKKFKYNNEIIQLQIGVCDVCDGQCHDSLVQNIQKYIEASNYLENNSILYSKVFAKYIQDFILQMKNISYQQIFLCQKQLFSTNPISVLKLILRQSFDTSQKKQVIQQFQQLFENEEEFNYVQKQLQQQNRNELKSSSTVNSYADSILSLEKYFLNGEFSVFYGWNLSSFFGIQNEYIKICIDALEIQLAQQLSQILQHVTNKHNNYINFVKVCNLMYKQTIYDIIDQTYDFMVKKLLKDREQSDFYFDFEQSSLVLRNLFTWIDSQKHNNNSCQYNQICSSINEFSEKYGNGQYIFNIPERLCQNSKLFKTQFCIQKANNAFQDQLGLFKYDQCEQIKVDIFPTIVDIRDDLTRFFDTLDNMPSQISEFDNYFILKTIQSKIQIPDYEDSYKYIKDKRQQIIDSFDTQIQQLENLKQQLQFIADQIFNNSADQLLYLSSYLINDTSDLPLFGNFSTIDYQKQLIIKDSCQTKIQYLQESDADNKERDIQALLKNNQSFVSISKDNFKKQKQIVNQIEQIQVQFDNLKSEQIKEQLIQNLYKMFIEYQFYDYIIKNKIIADTMFIELFSVDMKPLKNTMIFRVNSILLSIQAIVSARSFSIMEYSNKIFDSVQFVINSTPTDPRDWCIVRKFVDNNLDFTKNTCRLLIQQLLQLEKTFVDNFVGQQFVVDLQLQDQKKKKHSTQYELIHNQLINIRFDQKLVLDYTDIYSMLFSKTQGIGLDKQYNMIYASIELHLKDSKERLIQIIDEERNQLYLEMNKIIQQMDEYIRKIPKPELFITDHIKFQELVDSQFSFSGELMQQISSIKAKCLVFQQDEQFMGLPESDFTIIDELQHKLDLIILFWSLQSEQEQDYPDWIQKSFQDNSKLYFIKQDIIQLIESRINKFNQLINDITKEINGLQPNDKKQKLFIVSFSHAIQNIQFTLDDIYWFKANFSIFFALCYPFIKKRHIQMMAGQGIVFEPSVATVLKLKERNIFKLRKSNYLEYDKEEFPTRALSIMKISELAEKEYYIDSSFTEIDQKWQTFVLQMDADQYLISKLSELIQNIQEDTFKLKQLIQSEFATSFIRKIQSIIDRLEVIIQILDLLLQTQNNFYKLHQIFSQECYYDLALASDFRSFSTIYKSTLTTILKQGSLTNIYSMAGNIQINDNASAIQLESGQLTLQQVPLNLLPTQLFVLLKAYSNYLICQLEKSYIIQKQECQFLVNLSFEQIHFLQSLNYKLKNYSAEDNIQTIKQLVNIVMHIFDLKELDIEKTSMQENILSDRTQQLSEKSTILLQIRGIQTLAKDKYTFKEQIIVDQQYQIWLQSLYDMKQSEIVQFTNRVIQQNMQEVLSNEYISQYIKLSVIRIQFSQILKRFYQFSEIQNNLKILEKYSQMINTILPLFFAQDNQFCQLQFELLSQKSQSQQILDLDISDQRLQENILFILKDNIFTTLTDNQIYIESYSKFTVKYLYQSVDYPIKLYITSSMRSTLHNIFMQHQINKNVLYITGVESKSSVSKYYAEIQGYNPQILKFVDIQNLTSYNLASILCSSSHLPYCFILEDIDRFDFNLLNSLTLLLNLISSAKLSNKKLLFKYNKIDYVLNDRFLVIITSQKIDQRVKFPVCQIISNQEDIISCTNAKLQLAGIQNFGSISFILFQLMQKISFYYNESNYCTIRVIYDILDILNNFKYIYTEANDQTLIHLSLTHYFKQQLNMQDFLEFQNLLDLEFTCESDKVQFSSVTSEEINIMFQDVNKSYKQEIQQQLQVLDLALKSRNKLIIQCNTGGQFFIDKYVHLVSSIRKQNVKYLNLNVGNLTSLELFGQFKENQDWQKGILENVLDQFQNQQQQLILHITNVQNNDILLPILERFISLNNGQTIQIYKSTKILINNPVTFNISQSYKERCLFVNLTDISPIFLNMQGKDLPKILIERLLRLEPIILYFTQLVQVYNNSISYIQLLNNFSLMVVSLLKTINKDFLSNCDKIVYYSLHQAVGIFLPVEIQSQYQQFIISVFNCVEGQNNSCESLKVQLKDIQNYLLEPKFLQTARLFIQQVDINGFDYYYQDGDLIPIELENDAKSNEHDTSQFAFDFMSCNVLQYLIKSNINIKISGNSNYISFILDSVFEKLNKQKIYKSLLVANEDTQLQQFLNTTLQKLLPNLVAPDPTFQLVQIINGWTYHIQNEVYEIITNQSLQQNSNRVQIERLQFIFETTENIEGISYFDFPLKANINYYFLAKKLTSQLQGINKKVLTFISKFAQEFQIEDSIKFQIILQAIIYLSYSIDIILNSEKAQKLQFCYQLFLHEIEKEIQNSDYDDIVYEQYKQASEKVRKELNFIEQDTAFNFIYKPLTQQEQDELSFCASNLQQNINYQEKYEYLRKLQQPCKYIPISDEAVADIMQGQEKLIYTEQFAHTLSQTIRIIAKQSLTLIGSMGVGRHTTIRAAAKYLNYDIYLYKPQNVWQSAFVEVLRKSLVRQYIFVVDSFEEQNIANDVYQYLKLQEIQKYLTIEFIQQNQQLIKEQYALHLNNSEDSNKSELVTTSVIELQAMASIIIRKNLHFCIITDMDKSQNQSCITQNQRVLFSQPPYNFLAKSFKMEESPELIQVYKTIRDIHHLGLNYLSQSKSNTAQKNYMTLAQNLIYSFKSSLEKRRSNFDIINPVVWLEFNDKALKSQMYFSNQVSETKDSLQNVQLDLDNMLNENKLDTTFLEQLLTQRQKLVDKDKQIQISTSNVKEKLLQAYKQQIQDYKNCIQQIQENQKFIYNQKLYKNNENMEKLGQIICYLISYKIEGQSAFEIIKQQTIEQKFINDITQDCLFISDEFYAILQQNISQINLIQDTNNSPQMLWKSLIQILYEVQTSLHANDFFSQLLQIQQTNIIIQDQLAKTIEQQQQLQQNIQLGKDRILRLKTQKDESQKSIDNIALNDQRITEIIQLLEPEFQEKQKMDSNKLKLQLHGDSLLYGMIINYCGTQTIENIFKFIQTCQILLEENQISSQKFENPQQIINLFDKSQRRKLIWEHMNLPQDDDILLKAHIINGVINTFHEFPYIFDQHQLIFKWLLQLGASQEKQNVVINVDDVQFSQKLKQACQQSSITIIKIDKEVDIKHVIPFLLEYTSRIVIYQTCGQDFVLPQQLDKICYFVRIQPQNRRNLLEKKFNNYLSQESIQNLQKLQFDLVQQLDKQDDILKSMQMHLSEFLIPEIPQSVDISVIINILDQVKRTYNNLAMLQTQIDNTEKQYRIKQNTDSLIPLSQRFDFYITMGTIFKMDENNVQSILFDTFQKLTDSGFDNQAISIECDKQIDNLMNVKLNKQTIIKYKSLMLLSTCTQTFQALYTFLFEQVQIDNIIDTENIKSLQINGVDDHNASILGYISSLLQIDMKNIINQSKDMTKIIDIQSYLILAKLVYSHDFKDLVYTAFNIKFPYLLKSDASINDRVNFINNCQLQIPFIISSNTVYTQELLSYIATTNKTKLHVYQNLKGFINRYQISYQTDWHLVINQTNIEDLTTEFLEQYKKVKIFFINNQSLSSSSLINTVTQQLFLPANLSYQQIVLFGLDEFYQNFLLKEHVEFTSFSYYSTIVYSIFITKFKSQYYLPPQQFILKVAQLQEIYLLLEATNKDEQFREGLFNKISQWLTIFLQSFVSNQLDREWIQSLVQDLTIENRNSSLLQRFFDIKLTHNIKQIQMSNQLHDLFVKIPPSCDLILPSIIIKDIQLNHNKQLLKLAISSQDISSGKELVGFLIKNAIKTKRPISKLILQASYQQGSLSDIQLVNVGIRKIVLTQLKQTILDKITLQGMNIDVIERGRNTCIAIYSLPINKYIGEISFDDVGSETVRLYVPLK